MHELALTQSLVDLVAERTLGRQVTAVHVKVGLLSGVVPDAMAFCFDVATLETPLEGASLVLEEVPGRISCRACGAESAALDLILICDCGSADVVPVAGHELTLSSVELVKEPTCA